MRRKGRLGYMKGSVARIERSRVLQFRIERRKGSVGWR